MIYLTRKILRIKEKIMRIFNKILIVICVFALLSVGCVFAAIATDEEESNVGTVSELNALIGAAEGTTDPTLKYQAILSVVDYLDTYEMDENEAGYADAIMNVNKLMPSGAVFYLGLIDAEDITADMAYDYMVKADQLLELIELPEDTEGYADAKVKYDETLVRSLTVLVGAIDEDIENTKKTATNSIAIKKVRRVLADCIPYDEATDLSAVLETFNGLAELHEKALAANYRDLDSTNRISNYSLPEYISINWQGCAVGWDRNYLNHSGFNWTVDLKSGTNRVGIREEENGNKYYKHEYRTKINPEGSYAQIGMTPVDPSKGFVIEFDVAYFSTMPELGIFIETGGMDTAVGRVFPPHYFMVNGNGDICKPDGTVLLAGALVKGQWTHVVIVFDVDEFVYKIHAEGEYLGEYDASYSGVTFDHTKAAFRLSGKQSTSGDISYDNIRIYGGNNYRIFDKLDSMTADEKFLFMVNYFNNADFEIVERSNAYNMATELLGNYWIYTDEQTKEGEFTEYASTREDIMAAVNSYHEFDLESILRQLRSDNLDQYVLLVEALNDIERGMDTVIERRQQIELIQKFNSSIDGLIDMSADKNGNDLADHTEYTLLYDEVVRETGYDENASAFIRHIERFEIAPTLVAMERHYARARALLQDESLDLLLLTNPNHPDRAAFEDLLKAYEIYLNADSVIYDVTKESNSHKIIQCINKINRLTTEEEWLENEELVTEYIDIVKKIALDVNEGGDLLYDPNYSGVKSAIDFFNEVYGFFFARAQEEHVAYIGDILDRIMATESYIEKMGMVALLERYVNTQIEDFNLDLKDERITDLINNIDTCKSELKLRKEDYAKLLVQNSVYFVNLVERMRTSDNYPEQKAYYDEAALLYFNLDLTVEGTAKAVEIFDKYQIKIQRATESSKAFIEAVSLYKAATNDDERYAALVECYYHEQFLEPTYEGAEEALAEYREAYDSYMSYAESVNNTVAISANAVGSLRANTGVVTVIAIIIKKLFGV